MLHVTHKKTAAVAVTAVLALGGGGVAFAYFTSSGTGVGSAQVGTAASDVFILSTDGPTTPLLPGNGPQTFDVNVHNDSLQDTYVGTVYMSVMTGTGTDAATAAGTDIPGCDASWFTVTPSVAIDTVVPAGQTVSSTDLAVVAPTIAMPVADVNQDACQGALVGISFSTSGS